MNSVLIIFNYVFFFFFLNSNLFNWLLSLELINIVLSREMVSQQTMATTVRKVKQENRLRRQYHQQGIQMTA